VDGNLDNTDADYQGKYSFSSCYNPTKGTTVAEMTDHEQAWVVVFNIKRIEDAVKNGDFKDTVKEQRAPQREWQGESSKRASGEPKSAGG